MNSALVRTVTRMMMTMICYWFSQRTVRAWVVSPAQLQQTRRRLSLMAPSSSSSSSSSLFATSQSFSSITSSSASSASTSAKTKNENNNNKVINLSTVTKEELQTLLTTSWGHPKYRADQVWHWIRVQGITDVTQMNNLPKQLRQQLLEYTKPASLTLAYQVISKADGTIKRAYRCVDGQVIESVLMPYDDGRYTACISSQAGCAQGCVFCATGQMGFSRQLTADEIVEQVARFAAELQQEDKKENQDAATKSKTNLKQQQQQHGRSKRLSGVVFMGMGEPLANYRNVMEAVNRITRDLGIGARKITISTVGIVPNIQKLMTDPNVPQVRLAVSLHCATDEERSALLPANRRFGGLEALMTTLREYIDKTGRRVTLEWALIAGENDGPETARSLGRLIAKYGLRRDMVHVNVIPLNPTGGYSGAPSNRGRVNTFVNTLQEEFGIVCTPRVRRGIDIDAGCGQLKSKVLEKDNKRRTAATTEAFLSSLNQPFSQNPAIGVYEDYDNNNDDELEIQNELNDETLEGFSLEGAVDFESDDYEDPVYEDEVDKTEASRIVALVQGTTVDLSALDRRAEKPMVKNERTKR